MQILEHLRRFTAPYTFGWIATAAIIVCAVSGALLAVSYDVASPYLSITRFITFNPYAGIIRNIHYWSAQLFLILTLIHIIDHLRIGNESKVKKRGIWFRLTLSVLVSLYVMISGFILKADGDSIQAHRILLSLIQSLPWLGDLLAQTFIGTEGNYQIIYIQHVSTATIILFVVILEHARSLKVNLSVFLLTTLFIMALSLLLRAPLTDLQHPVMKGPWYFIGLQEILHWISNPLFAMLGMVLLLILIYITPFVNKRFAGWIKQFLLLVLVVYALLSITGYFFRGPMWNWQWPWQNKTQTAVFPFKQNGFRSSSDTLEVSIVQGRVEGCVSCHKNMKGFSESHKPEFIGCYSCHGGNPYTLNKEIAHSAMRLIPGNLNDAAISCGNGGCHPAIVHRVNTSLMTSLSGMITVDKWLFGETSDIDMLSHVKDIKYSDSETHLRNLCVGCHLENQKIKTGPADWLERGGGCLACHLTYDKKALFSLQSGKTISTEKNVLPEYHPLIDLQVTNDKCISCHSRSGRISMNYEGWHETKLKPEQVKNKSGYRTLPDKRVFVQVTEDVHHKVGMLCIDCHSSYEVMGDGKHYAHKEEAVKIQCSDCHKQLVDNTKLLTNTDQETRLIAWLRKYDTKDVKVLTTQKGDIPLVNTWVDNSTDLPMMIRKSGQGIQKLKSPATACSEGVAHQRLSCEACHTSWAPQCIGCHTGFDKKAKGFDMLKNKNTKGSWVEYSTQGLAELPVLGVSFADKTKKKGSINTFVPGMIMTLDKGSSDGTKNTSFHRLHAPVAAHTTTRQSRSCASCHTNPLAIGFGRGLLTYSSYGKWTFEPEYENNKFDGLPEDAWTGFLKERIGVSATRNAMRPFNIEEQKKILRVGACLTCHPEQSSVMKQSLQNFEKQVQKMSAKCIKPTF